MPLKIRKRLNRTKFCWTRKQVPGKKTSLGCDLCCGKVKISSLFCSKCAFPFCILSSKWNNQTSLSSHAQMESTVRDVPPIESVDVPAKHGEALTSMFTGAGPISVVGPSPRPQCCDLRECLKPGKCPGKLLCTFILQNVARRHTLHVVSLSC